MCSNYTEIQIILLSATIIVFGAIIAILGLANYYSREKIKLLESRLRRTSIDLPPSYSSLELRTTYLSSETEEEALGEEPGA